MDFKDELKTISFNNIYDCYNSLKEASADTGILLGGISKVLIGNRPTAGGYIWKYKN